MKCEFKITFVIGPLRPDFLEFKNNRLHRSTTDFLALHISRYQTNSGHIFIAVLENVCCVLTSFRLDISNSYLVLNKVHQSEQSLGLIAFSDLACKEFTVESATLYIENDVHLYQY